MRLDRIQINNFRSIEDVEVTFDPTCRVLVGINESGKSNILNALALLNKDYVPAKKNDLREALPDEEPITKSFVRFIFKFEKTESDELLNSVSEKLLARNRNPKIILQESKQYTAKEFCATRDEGIYSIDIIDEAKSFSYWTFSTTFKLLNEWKKPSNLCPQDFTVELNGEKCKLLKYKFIRAVDFTEIPVDYLENATIGDFSRFVGSQITEITKKYLPDAIVWEYDERNLLPNSVKISTFASTPDTCVPLKNMFILAGIDDIKNSINTAKEGSHNQFQNYLNRIAKKTTNHFRKVWKEYKNIEFSLRLNNDEIIPGVKEKNTLDFARRSDGFKRFVTFLLLISVNVKTNNLQNTLLLIDEPEGSLHPSGARYLRDELISISKKNYVVYSTHSIFMVDSSDISRHYIVRKKDEITSIEPAKESNIADEEVIYNALGHSVFSILKENNIIFEGWNDKQLFKIAIENAAPGIKNKFKNAGVCHARGVNSIKTITPMMALAKRDCLIISDSDKPAKDQQKKYKQDKGYGTWKTYHDFDSSIKAVTGEDFIKNDYIAKQVKAILANSTLPTFDKIILPADKGKIESIKKWLLNNGMTEEQAKDTLKQIKGYIFENLRHQDIEDSYIVLLKGIASELRNT